MLPPTSPTLIDVPSTPHLRLTIKEGLTFDVNAGVQELPFRTSKFLMALLPSYTQHQSWQDLYQTSFPTAFPASFLELSQQLEDTQAML
jgi:hypothetical protein